jgi:phosphinothricin acetyltransferase
MPVTVCDARDDDVEAIARIQNALIATTTIEWTDEPYSIESRRTWLDDHRRAGFPVVVAEVEGAVAGFAAYGDFRDTRRWPGYDRTVETTVHVGGERWGLGVGRLLVDELCRRAAGTGVHALVAAIDADNEGSVRFHERIGFTEVGRLPEVGHGHGRWLDLVLMVRLLPGAPPAA